MILVIGANGMLGHDLMEVLQGDVRGLDLPELDITDLVSVRKALLTLKPEIIINSAAYTDVDGCEKQPDLAYRINVVGTRNVAAVALQLGCSLVYISTDYVFDGTLNRLGARVGEEHLPATAEKTNDILGQLGPMLDVEEVAHVHELVRLFAERGGHRGVPRG